MPTLSPKQALWLMVLSLLIAAGLRLPNLLTAPPGAHYDEAANAILAADIGLRGERPIFISSYTGKETLFFYAAGLVNAGLGPGQELLALRLTALFLSLLTIAATYWLGWELTHDRRLALLAAILLATSFWHLLFSRLGFRAISQPLWQAVMLAAFLRGLWRGGKGWFAFSGVALGLTAYTYLAARLFPVLLLFSSWPLLLDRVTWRRVWRPLLLLLTTAVVTLLPLLWYFTQNPAAFWVRIEQVGTGGAALSLGESIWRSLGMFGFEGDPYWRFNVPGRPLFPPLWFGLGVLGWGIAGWRVWRGGENRGAHGRVAYLLLLLNPFIMLLPTALATNEIVPSNLRAIGLLPLLIYLPALGTVVLLDSFAPRLPTRIWGGGLTALLLISSLFTAQVYFGEWATRTDLFYENDGDLTAVSAYLNERSGQLPTPIFIGSRFYQHPTVALLAQDYPDLRWLIESRALVIPPDGQATYLIPARSPLPLGLQRLLQTAQPVIENGPLGPDGEPLFTRYTITQLPEANWGRSLEANFGYGVTLLGADVGSGTAGSSLPLTLYWRVEGLPPYPETWVPFVHLEDEFGYRWSQQEPNPYPSEQWQVGEVFVQEVPVRLPEGMPPGRYKVRVGLFAPSTGTPLARFDAAGRYAGSGVTLADVYLLPEAGLPEQTGEPEVVLNTAVFDENSPHPLTLLGHQPAHWTISGGEPIPLELWWQASGETPLPYLTSRFELMRPDNTGKILADTQPAHATFPFALWPAPQFVRDRQNLPTPPDLAAGEYRLQLRLLSADDQTRLLQPVGTVTVRPSDRSFTLPDLPNFTPLDAILGEEIALRGYALDEAAGTLTLVWQAVAEPSADYTAFVHLLNEDGSCCVWQQDTPPSARGTSLWLVDEVVTTTYAFGEQVGANWAVGLYLPENGQRLAVRGGNTAVGGADFVPLGGRAEN